MPGHREVHPIIKEAEAKAASLFGGGWHTDSPFLEEPPAITTLRAVDVPPFGGDTSWANCALAFRHLSKTYQDMLRPLARAHVSAANNYATQTKLMGKAIPFADQEQFEQGQRGTYHPLVRTHPETGEESLYICDTYTAGIEGMTTFEAKPIIDFLVAHCTQAAFCLPAALGGRDGGDVGQPRRHAPRPQRLRRVPPGNVPDDHCGHETGLSRLSPDFSLFPTGVLATASGSPPKGEES